MIGQSLSWAPHSQLMVVGQWQCLFLRYSSQNMGPDHCLYAAPSWFVIGGEKKKKTGFQQVCDIQTIETALNAPTLRVKIQRLYLLLGIKVLQF